MTEAERRIRRPAVSCSACRKRKIRCNRETPCSNCIRSKSTTCVYESQPLQPAPQRVALGHQTEHGEPKKSPQLTVVRSDAFSSSGRSTVTNRTSPSIAESSTVASTLQSQTSAQKIEYMKNQIRHWEEQLSKVAVQEQPSPISSLNAAIETSNTNLTGTIHLHREDGQPQAIARSITHKKRFFGQSHWINVFVLFQDLCQAIEPGLRNETSKVVSDMKRCKSLARVIKFHRTPPWPSPVTVDLPPKDVADALVDRYLRTSESIYRILHVPTFRREYEAVWTGSGPSDMAFMVQLKLIFAIGATTYDEKFTLRASAIRWVYEAQTWNSEPKFKSKLSIQSLQLSLLLLIAQELADVSGDSVWPSAGALLRRAMYMGLHTDPVHLPKVSVFVAEMRRRLWNTILEVALQSSLTAGGPPLISLSDFDTRPPSNLDDDQLLIESPLIKPEDHSTDVSIAIALRKTLPVRLSVTKFLNDFGSHGTYAETLRLDAEVRAVHKVAYQALQQCKSNSKSSPSIFEKRVVDFLMHRYLSALHIPFFSLSLHDTPYAFSRRVVSETSLKIWYAIYPPPSVVAAQALSDEAPLHREDLSRLTTCGRGLYRTVAMQATVLIAVELRAQLQEEQNLGPIRLRPDLLAVLEDTKAWCLQCIEAGETNIKGYLLMKIISASVEGLMRGLGVNELPELLIKAAEDAEETCIPMLEKVAAQGQTEGVQDDHLASSLDTDGMENWDFMMSDGLFDHDSGDPMTWIFNDGNAQGLSVW